MRNFLTFLMLCLTFLSSSAQSIESLSKQLEPYFSVLTTWGVRPEWDEKSENIYFLNKLVGDVFRINLETRQITAITSHFYHGGIYRVQCLPNGDLLLSMTVEKFDPNDPERERHKSLGLYILKSEGGTFAGLPVFLSQYSDEGPAVSKNKMMIAWTVPGQREIKAGDIRYQGSDPELVNVRTIINYKDSSAYVRLETQDFRPPANEELIYTHYWGDARDQYFHSQVFGFNLRTKKYTKYTDLANSYNEAEGIFPDGNYLLVESDRHQPSNQRNKYKLDVYRLKLDGSGETERLANFSTMYPDLLRSDNPVVNNRGNLIALQFGLAAGSGDGRGIFLFDIPAFEAYKKHREKSQTKDGRQGRINPATVHDRFYQYSVWPAFVNKVFEGGMTISDLKTKGNLGLGSYSMLDGELIMLEGIIYKVSEDGHVTVASENDRAVYANAAFFERDETLRLSNGVSDFAGLREQLRNRINPNFFYAFKISGSFRNMKCGGLHRQSRPFDKGLDYLIPNRPVFEKKNIKGTIVGFYCPKFIENINVSGFHFHFISDDRRFGGHVMEFKNAAPISAEIDQISSYEFALPENDDFRNAKMDKTFQYQTY